MGSDYLEVKCLEDRNLSDAQKRKWCREKLKAVEPDRSRIKSWTHHLMNCGGLKNHLTSLSFGCLICKIVLRTPTQQSHSWAHTPRKPELKETHVPQCSSQHCL